MNARLFEEYMEQLCHHCTEKGYKEVVFCMDNAKNHRREFIGSSSEENRKTLSALNKTELIDRLVTLNPKLDAIQLKACLKPELYEMAKQPEYQ
ncbi:hypothetical protein BGX29_005627, partial [Mortierella sp. GBA35]